MLSEIDQSCSVVLACRRLHQQARTNDHLLLPTTELRNVHRLRTNQIHRHPPRNSTQSGAIELLLDSIHITLEVPYRIRQQHRCVRRAAKAIERMKVAHNLATDPAIRVRDWQPVENNISRVQRI